MSKRKTKSHMMKGITYATQAYPRSLTTPVTLPDRQDYRHNLKSIQIYKTKQNTLLKLSKVLVTHFTYVTDMLCVKSRNCDGN